SDGQASPSGDYSQCRARPQETIFIYAGTLVRAHQSFLSACSGFPLRLVEAISSSSFLLMDSYMEREAPLSSFTGVSPRLAESAAPAAFCCAFDFAGMGVPLLTKDPAANMAAALLAQHAGCRLNVLCSDCARFPVFNKGTCGLY